MENRNYDDWNDEFELNCRKKAAKALSLNVHVYAVVAVVCSALLSVVNIINAYSLGCVSYTSDFSFNSAPLLRQLVYVVAGIAACIFSFAVPERFLKVLSPALVLGCCLSSVLDIVFPIGLIQKNWYVLFIYMTGLLYCSAYFSNRQNTISGLSDITIPCVVSVVNIIILSSTGKASYVIFYMLLTLLIFLVGGVGTAGVVLLVLFCSVPSAVFVLASPSRLRSVIEFFVPGLSAGGSQSVLSIARSAIESGRLTGKGIGLGSYKYILSGYADIVPFCSFAEETGFIGVLLLFLLTCLVSVSGYAASHHTVDSDCFLSNLCFGMSTIIFCRFILHISYLIGLLPFSGVTCPFITPGPDIIFMMFYIGIVFRASAVNPLSDEDEESVPMSSFGDEYYFKENGNESRKS